MTRYKTGDIVLLQFPFTDLTTKKRRPASVISPGVFSACYGDIVVIPLTGRKQRGDSPLEMWQESGLLKPTWLKPLVATVVESSIEKKLGTLCPGDEGRVQSTLGMLIDSRFLPGHSA